MFGICLLLSVLAACATYLLVDTRNRSCSRPLDKPEIVRSTPVENLNNAFDTLLEVRRRLDESEHRLEDIADWMVSPHVVRGVDARLSLQPLVEARLSLKRALKELVTTGEHIRDARVSRKTIPPPSVKQSVVDVLNNTRKFVVPSGELAVVVTTRAMTARIDQRDSAEKTNPMYGFHLSGAHEGKRAEKDWVRSAKNEKK